MCTVPFHIKLLTVNILVYRYSMYVRCNSSLCSTIGAECVLQTLRFCSTHSLVMYALTSGLRILHWFLKAQSEKFYWDMLKSHCNKWLYLANMYNIESWHVVMNFVMYCGFGMYIHPQCLRTYYVNIPCKTSNVHVISYQYNWKTKHK